MLPLSATMISAARSALAIALCAFLMQMASVSTSFRHGMTMETSTAVGVWRSPLVRVFCATLMVRCSSVTVRRGNPAGFPLRWAAQRRLAVITPPSAFAPGSRPEPLPERLDSHQCPDDKQRLASTGCVRCDRGIARSPRRSYPFAGVSPPRKEVTPTDRLSGAGTRPCGPVPAPSHVSLGAVEKCKGHRSGLQGRKSVRRQPMSCCRACADAASGPRVVGRG